MKINPFSPPEMMDRDGRFSQRPQRQQRDRHEQVVIAFLGFNALILLVAVIAAGDCFFRYR